MVYLEYEKYKARFHELQENFNDVLLEKERLFTKTQPNAIRYDKDKVQVSIDGNSLEEYVIALEREHINERLGQLRIMMDDRHKLLMLKEEELRRSHELFDKIYVCRFLEGMNINRIARTLNYSRSQVYRDLQRMKKTISNDATICDKKCVNV